MSADGVNGSPIHIYSSTQGITAGGGTSRSGQATGQIGNLLNGSARGNGTVDTGNSQYNQILSQAESTDDRNLLQQFWDWLTGSSPEDEAEAQEAQNNADGAQRDEQAGAQAASAAKDVLGVATAKLTEAKNAVTTADSQVQSITATVEQNKANVQTCTRTRDSAKQKYEQLKNMSAAEQEKNPQYAAELAAAKTAYDEAEAALKQAEAELQENETKLGEAEKALADAKTALGTAQSEHDAAKSKSDESNSLWNTLKSVAKQAWDSLPQVLTSLAQQQMTAQNTVASKLGQDGTNGNSAVNSAAAQYAAAMTGMNNSGALNNYAALVAAEQAGLAGTSTTALSTGSGSSGTGRQNVAADVSIFTASAAKYKKLNTNDGTWA